MRPLFIVVPVLASTLLLAVPASASTSYVGAAGPGAAPSAGMSRVPGVPSGVPGAAAPGEAVRGAAGRLIDAVLNGVSCTTQPDNSSITSACSAVGFFLARPYVNGLLESSNNGAAWTGNIFGGLDIVTDPVQVSCVPQQYDIPTCVAVGEYYRNPNHPRQLVSTGGANGFSPVTFRNPKGDNWSVLDDVSCASSTFCMLVGSAGTTQRTSHGLRYLAHANVYRWNGSGLRRLKIPGPAHAKTTELASVSCPTTSSCMAVGDYARANGPMRPYSALWTSGTWRVQLARTIGGKRRTLFQAVSCFAAGSCVAVGDAAGPSTKAFAEQYSGSWTVQHLTAGRRTVLDSISCPGVSDCVAVGSRASRSLIETWNGTGWASQAVPGTPRPFTTNALFHVSCITPAICTAVGARHNPKTRFSNRTLALGWNGSKWTIQKTLNS